MRSVLVNAAHTDVIIAVLMPYYCAIVLKVFVNIKGTVGRPGVIRRRYKKKKKKKKVDITQDLYLTLVSGNY